MYFWVVQKKMREDPLSKINRPKDQLIIFTFGRQQCDGFTNPSKADHENNFKKETEFLNRQTFRSGTVKNVYANEVHIP